MDYKNTLNLPRTDFPMKADLVTREPQRLDKWRQANLYQEIQKQRAGAARFVLHDGPPFANGEIHLGHVLNKILKDIILKYKTLRGFNAPYVPGWDCHGLPIEFKVTQELRKSGHGNADSATIRTACDAYARKFVALQRDQFKRLGVFGDWDHPYLTLDKKYEAEELRLFADIVEQGFVYRGKKPVYWSIPCRTALAEAEVEYQDHVSQSVYVRFPVVGLPNTSILIWTTTPWTLPANLAVAYNAAFSYSVVEVGGQANIVFSGLLASIAEKCQWQNYRVVRTLNGEDLGKLEYQHPFCNRRGKLHAAEFVESSTGTGFVHVAPGHGLEDYGLGMQKGLPIYSPVSDDGTFMHTDDLPAEQQMPGELLGKSILEKNNKSEANEAVLALLREKGALAHQENYTHSYPHCWRSKTPVIFRAMDQWFIRINHAVGDRTFRQLALQAIDQVNWVPQWGINRIKGAVEARPDWCISRQRTWGVPLPAFYDAARQPILNAEVVRNLAALFEQHGSNIWFEKTAAELWSMVKPKLWGGPEAVEKSHDTLDVWIDSGSSSRAVTAARAELAGAKFPFQADMYLEGSDQHRGWFQSSLLLSLAGSGAPPFKTVLTHGFIVNDAGEKESKSRGAKSAEIWVKDFGADVLRLWVASQDYRGDIVLSEGRITKVGETYRNIRNCLRYQLSNLFDFEPAKHAVPDDKLTWLDRWVLAEFSKLECDVIKAYDEFEFHVVYQKISQFVSVELSAIYHDVVKDRLYTDAANSLRRRSTQTALHRLVTGLCRMLSPMLAFTADEAWEFVPKAQASFVHGEVWEPKTLQLTPEEEAFSQVAFKQLREPILAELEKARQAKIIGKALEARARVSVAHSLKPALETRGEALREVVNVSCLEIMFTDAAAAATPTVEVAHAGGNKCDRCWHWEDDVGAQTDHPTLCGRCVEAVKGRD